MPPIEHFRVLRIFQQLSDPQTRRMIEGGQQPALCYKGRKYIVCVVVGHPIRVVKRPVEDFDDLESISVTERSEVSGKIVSRTVPYPVQRAIKTFQDMASRCGITAGARLLLDKAAGSAAQELDEDEFENEEETTMTKENPNPTEESAGETESEGSTERTAAEAPAGPTSKPKRSGAKSATGASTTEEKATVAKKKATSKPKAKASGPKKDKGPSACQQACDFMREQVKAEGGKRALERGFLKELFEKTGKKFGLKASTCGIQYNRHVLNKGK